MKKLEFKYSFKLNSISSKILFSMQRVIFVLIINNVLRRLLCYLCELLVSIQLSKRWEKILFYFFSYFFINNHSVPVCIYVIRLDPVYTYVHIYIPYFTFTTCSQRDFRAICGISLVKDRRDGLPSTFKHYILILCLY